MKDCPAGKKERDCPCPEYSKEGLCDWPYAMGMSYEWIKDNMAIDAKLYKLRGSSDYFREKYGTPNPPFIISGEDTEIWRGGWREHSGPACTIYGWRNGVEPLPTEGKVYYGYVICVGPGEGSTRCFLGEVVHESELEPVEWDELELASSENITFENTDPDLIGRRI